MSTTITVDVSEAVKKLDPRTMEKYLVAALDGAADIIRADIKEYPPKPEGSTYIRTMTLHDSWTKKIDRGGLQATIGTNVGYAPYVQDADRQAWMHRGRWQTAQSVARDKAQDVKRLVERALNRWAR